MAAKEGISLKGQGASEYLMILGAVLIVSLVAASLLGFFPGSVSQVPSTQSQIYWSGYAAPYSVRDSLYVTSGSCRSYNASGVHLLVKNTEKWPLNLTAVYVDGSSVPFCIAGSGNESTSLPFLAGEEKVVATRDNTGSRCANRTRLDISLGFRYNTPYSQNKLQTGEQKLVVSCQ